MSATAVLLAISREDAKRLFAQKDDASLRAFLLAQIEQAKGESMLSLGETWEPLQRALAQDGAGAPLADALLGGRSLHRSDTWQALFKRPDAVPHIAAALANLSNEELSARLRSRNGDAALSSMESLFEAVRAFYQAAVANQQAAIFVVQP